MARPEITGPTVAATDYDELVPDPLIAREFSVSLMTLWRWSRDPHLRFPPAVKIRGRNHRSRRQIEALIGTITPFTYRSRSAMASVSNRCF